MKYSLIVFGALLALLGTSCKTSAPATAESKPKEGPKMLFQDALSGRTAQRYVDACTEMIKGDYPQAIQGFVEVLESNPSYHAASFNIAKMSLSLRKYEDAITYGKDALANDPENYWYYKILQESYEASGDYPQAILVQESLVQKFPDKHKEQLTLAKLYRRDNQGKKSIQALDKLEEEVGGSRELWIEKLSILEGGKNWEDGLAVLDKLVNAYPEEGQFIEKQYNFLNRLGRSDEGAKKLEALLEVDPDNGFAALKLADHFKSKGELDKSDKYLFLAFENPTIDPEGKLDIINQLLQFASSQGDEVIPRARKLADIFQRTHPGSAKVDLLEAKIFVYEGKLDIARDNYLSALKASSTDIDLWYELLGIDLQLGEFQWLFVDAEEALTYYPNQKQLLYFYGLGAALEEKWEEANYALKKAARLSADEDLLKKEIDLAKNYADWAQGQMPSDQLQNYLKSLNTSAKPIYLLFSARYSLKENDLVEAKKLLKKANKQNGSPYVDLIDLSIQQSEYQEAQSYIDQLKSLCQTPTLLEAWGDLLYKQGMNAQAEEKWKEAIEKGALDLNIRRKLNQ